MIGVGGRVGAVAEGKNHSPPPGATLLALKRTYREGMKGRQAQTTPSGGSVNRRRQQSQRQTLCVDARSTARAASNAAWPFQDGCCFRPAGPQQLQQSTEAPAHPASTGRHTHRRQPQECAGIRRFGSSEKSEKSEKSEESAWSATSTATWSAPVPPSSFDAPV